MPDAPRTLALETSGRAASVALLEGSRLLSRQQVGPPLRTAQSLIPALRELLSEVGWQPRDVELVAVAAGPGSFTGLRIGVTAAKTFAYTVQADIVAVDTLEAIARQAPVEADRLWVVMDAQRDELFAARFEPDEGSAWTMSEPTRIIGRREWLAGLTDGDAVTGPALARRVDELPQTVRPVEEALWLPTAEAVGRLGLERYAQGHRDDVWQLVPQYFRPSAAEEKRGKKA